MLLEDNKELCKVRTITTFISFNENKNSWKQEIKKASKLCFDLSEAFKTKGYTIQSIRIVTNPFGEYLKTTSLNEARSDLLFLNNILNSIDESSIRIRFAIGEARTANEIALLPELIKEFGDLCNVCVNIGTDESGILDDNLIQHSAKVVAQVSKITPRGEGNFNFTVNFNCKPLIPYFPASYHRKELGRRFVVGLETPDLLVEVLKEFNRNNHNLNHNDLYKGYYEAMSSSLQYYISDLQSIIEQTALDKDFLFSGFDSSSAPSKNCSSITEIYEEMGLEFFGASGTVEASSLLTKVFKSIKNVELVGFSGLMLALTEDTGLAQGTIESNFEIRSLLTYSSVCGIGLDTVPIPGNTSVEKISALMRDTGTMAFRLNKPLTVRLFPVPNLKAGEMTAFESDDLCNCAVLAVP